MIKKILLLLMFLPVYLLAWKMESGTQDLPATIAGTSTWETVDLQQKYDEIPLIFALVNEGSGYSADSPVALRVRNVTTTGFEIVQVEPQSSEAGEVEGEHAAVNIHYIAIEPGDHTLSDGTRIFADTHDTTTKEGREVSGPKDSDNIIISPAFSSTPIVLAMIQSLANEDSNLPGASSSPWMTAHVTGVDSGDFDVTLDRAETSTGSITSDETIGYLVIDSGVSGTILSSSCQSQSITYQTINTGDIVGGWGNNNGCYPQSLGITYADMPNVIGSMQSRDGGDGGWLRRCSLTNSTVGVTVDEDQAYNSERSHMQETVGLIIFSQDFVYDSTFSALNCGLVAEYRMDECYWLGSGNFDVMDHQAGNNAEAYNNASTDKNDAIINFSGGFIATGYFQPENTITLNLEWTYSYWMKFPLDSTDHEDLSSTTFGFDYYFVSASLVGRGDLPAFTLQGSDLQWAVYDENGGFTKQDIDDSFNTSGWRLITFTKESDDTTKLYIDGNYVDVITRGTDGDIGYFLASSDNLNGQTLSTKVDEVKIWDRALSDQEIANMESNESIGNNYDGSIREPVSCDATINANSWELVGIPIDLRTDPKTVAQTFQGMTGTYDTNWRVYRRDYSDTNNSSWYTYLDATDPMEFGKGYWLGNGLSTEETWNVDGTQAVDYDSAQAGCPANQCVEIDVKSVSLDFTTDTNDGTGPYRYNLTGFVGKSPVSWADCRFIIDGTAYTPTAAEDEGYASKVIWQYNPGNSGTDANGYTSCDDTTPGTCMLEPYKGFWVELHGSTKNLPVKLLIPQE